MAGKNITILSDANFQEQALDSDLPVLVDFWAAWCGPCKMIAPFLEKLADEKVGKVKIAKLNVDENPDISVKYGIRSIPTLIMFKGGKQIDTLVGADPDKIRNMVDKA